MNLLQRVLRRLGIASVAELHEQQAQLTALMEAQASTDEKVRELETAFTAEISAIHGRSQALSGNFRNHKQKTEEELRALAIQVESILSTLESMERLQLAEAIRPQIVRLRKSLRSKGTRLKGQINALGQAANDQDIERTLCAAVNDG